MTVLTPRIDVTPRARALAARRTTTLSVLDIGTTKIVCMIADLVPAVTSDVLRGRSHMVRVKGIGQARSMGVKGGAINDMEAAEQAIRQAVDAAERMAKVDVRSVIVTMSGGRLSSQHLQAQTRIGNGPVTPKDKSQVLQTALAHGIPPGRAILHALPLTYQLDGQGETPEPLGMLGEQLGVDLHVVSADIAATRNLMLAVERCHLEVEAVVATPYAAGLAALVDDEAEMGALLIDCGGGTTSVGIFANGSLTHIDAFAVGGNHITMDIARGLSTRVNAAERLKTLYGSALSFPSDERETIAVAQVEEGERDYPNHIPKAHLVKIIRPRVEEILELVRDRLKSAGVHDDPARKIVLTGGGAGLSGLPETVKHILKGQVRIGRPLGLKGLPEAAKGPAFAASAGLLIYPQVAGLEHSDFSTPARFQATGTDGYFSRFGRWIKESF